ncbi:MAG TPA: FadR/GntR family transcriptional regulator [Syntrophomonadaceae bacterium]|nr:FadR/GntR family transcriptional regulator [Syntrophomonadaceae bacterium]
MDKSVDILSVSEQIVVDILNSILGGEIKLGQKLPTESFLAEKYGVSRPTVRDALTSLEDSLVLQPKKGCHGGWFVKNSNNKHIARYLESFLTMLLDSEQIKSEDLLEMRLILEVKGCGIAAMNRTVEDIQAIAAAIPLNYNEMTDYEYHSQDIEFHRRIAEATHNPLIIASIKVTTMVQELYAMTTDAPPTRRKELNNNLLDIFQAIVKQQPREAEEAMKIHLSFADDMTSNAKL